VQFESLFILALRLFL